VEVGVVSQEPGANKGQCCLSLALPHPLVVVVEVAEVGEVVVVEEEVVVVV
jgi:hypothetical protein